MSHQVPEITLNDGHRMPQLGFGVFQVPEAETSAAVSAALETGYRHIDTAAIYRNETGVGRAVEESGIGRDELFITTKLWPTDFDSPRRALEQSLEKLGMDHVDLYLIHWPAPQTDAYLEVWGALEQLLEEGLTRSVGVSNFLPEHLDRVVDLGGTVPAVNQVELHPAFQNRTTVDANRRYDIATEAWSPLAQGAVLDDDAVLRAAETHGVSPAQAVIRWHLQHGNIVIPKSVTPERIASNFDVFGFELSEDEMAGIDALERDGRTGAHPNEVNPS